MKSCLALILMSFALLSCKKENVEIKEGVIENAVVPFAENSTVTDSLYTAAYLPTSTTKQIIKHQYYALSYNEKFEQAEWVAYELKKEFEKPRLQKTLLY